MKGEAESHVCLTEGQNSLWNQCWSFMKCTLSCILKKQMQEINKIKRIYLMLIKSVIVRRCQKQLHSFANLKIDFLLLWSIFLIQNVAEGLILSRLYWVFDEEMWWDGEACGVGVWAVGHVSMPPPPPSPQLITWPYKWQPARGTSARP